MKKTVSIVLLILVCCVFAPFNALASNKTNSVNMNNSVSEEITSDSEGMSDEESVKADIHAQKLAEKEADRGTTSSQSSRVVSPPSDDSNRFTIGWIVALVILVGAGVGVYIYNRRKK